MKHADHRTREGEPQMGSFKNWREADEVWARENAEVLRATFLTFYQAGEWPNIRDLQRQRDIAGKATPSVVEIARGKPSIPGQANFQSSAPQSLIINARHLLTLGVPQAQLLLDALVISSTAAVEAYMDSAREFPLAITNQEVAFRWKLDPHALGLVPRFVSSDYPTPFSGFSWSENTWSMGVSESFVMNFQGATTYQTYVDRQLSVIEGWCAEADKKDINLRTARNLRAFLAMPFTQPWSNATHEMVRESIRQAGLPIDLVRLDEVHSPGRITEQLVEELQLADFLIVDITGVNANVVWELGYAEALGKPSVIIRRRDDETKVPFDIYDHRQVRYDDPVTTQQIKELSGHLSHVVATLM